METDKTIVGKCPLCGGDVVKTLKGYACVNSLSASPSCNFFLFSSVGNRRFSDAEVIQLLAERQILLDGFASKEGKNFSAILKFNQDGSVDMSYTLGICPKCGGTLYVGARSVSCGNYKNPQSPCNFTIWRNMAGHTFSLSELNEILTSGVMAQPVDTYDAQGNRQQTRFGLNSAKEVARL